MVELLVLFQTVPRLEYVAQLKNDSSTALDVELISELSATSETKDAGQAERNARNGVESLPFIKSERFVADVITSVCCH